MSRIVVITGASRGLGSSLTKYFLKKGDRVIGISRSLRGWKQTLHSLPNREQLSYQTVDLTKEMEVRKFARSFEKKVGHVDLLINNAGYGGILARMEKQTRKEFEKHLQANLVSTFLMCKYFVPFFRKQKKGKIFNLSSMAGTRGVPRLSAYCASKFAVIGLTQCIAKENVDIDLQCITICPGGMDTEMRAVLFGKKDAHRQQTTDFVAEQILKIADNDLILPSGSDIVIRHGKITAIHTPPST